MPWGNTGSADTTLIEAGAGAGAEAGAVVVVLSAAAAIAVAAAVPPAVADDGADDGADGGGGGGDDDSTAGAVSTLGATFCPTPSEFNAMANEGNTGVYYVRANSRTRNLFEQVIDAELM